MSVLTATRKEDTTLDFDVNGQSLRLWVHYTFYPRVPDTYHEPDNPDYIEIEKVIYKGVNITDVISLVNEDFFVKLEARILKNHE